MKLPSTNAHNFATVASANISRSTFNRGNGHKTTLNTNSLVPMMVDEIYPGDSIDLKVKAFARINTPIFPLMDNIHMDYHAFFVPHRLVHDNWVKLMGEQVDPSDTIDYLTPQIECPVGGFTEASLHDYMGLPTKEDIEDINNFAGRAYNLIFNSWYRDENLQDSVVVDKDDGPDSITDYVLLNRNKRNDYFTSCLPWPQKGDAVNMPLGSSAPITGLGTSSGTFAGAQSAWETDGSGSILYAGHSLNIVAEEDPNNSGHPNIRADLTNATAATINEWREALAVQTLLERSARGGTRYTEIILSMFSVRSPDARQQRPEFLGSVSSDVKFQEIAQTSSTDGTSPQANMSAQGKIMLMGNLANKSFTEHGTLMVIASIRADLTYQQGINKMWSRRSRLDHYFPDTANLGEQAVLSKEIFADGSAGDQDVFGYQERWAEMRYKESIITGLLRSNATGTLDPYHLSQEFTTRPVLDTDFIEEDVPMDRIVAVTSEPDFIIDQWFNYSHTRPMPTYSIPGLAGRL